MRIHPVFASFTIFGLINNVLYVLILSAAVDLVGTKLPKGIVLLADVIPGFLIKLTAPFFIHKIAYKTRVYTLVALSCVGMLLVAGSGTLVIRMLGVVFASASSGLGEITFLQLTHYYDQASINGFSCGTGAAGLVGSFCYLFFTTWIRLNPRFVLFVFSFAPFLFVWVYFSYLPAGRAYHPVPQEGETPKLDAAQTLNRIKPLVVPYILPLTTVYVGEYIINQGISPTLLFDKRQMPFTEYRDAYVTYGTLYQIGVFISRSSAPFFRVKQLYVPAVLQTINLVLCVLQSMFVVIPSIYPLFILMIYEGLLGGLAYVNTYMLVSETVAHSDREFSMGAVGVSDSAGVVMAGFISLWLEPALCSYQIANGRPWCRGG